MASSLAALLFSTGHESLLPFLLDILVLGIPTVFLLGVWLLAQVYFGAAR